MKLTPLATPGDVKPTTPAPSPAADARARAIAKLSAGAPPSAPEAAPTPSAHAPQMSQNAIAPEDMSAILQNDSIETPIEATEAPTETPVEETAPAKDPAVSRQFAQLARQERALRQKAQAQEQSFKAREEALKTREAELSRSPATPQEGYYSRDQLKRNALGVLAEAGVSYDELTQQVLNTSAVNPAMEAEMGRLKAEIQALRNATDEGKKAAEQQQQQAYQAAIKQLERDTKNLVTSDPAFETIKATGSIRDVVDLITETYNKDGYIMSVEEAAQAVEDYLVEEAMKLAKIDKIQKRLQPVTSPAAANQAKQTAQTPTPAQNTPAPRQKTLTNAMASNRQMNVRERAIAAFKGEKF